MPSTTAPTTRALLAAPTAVLVALAALLVTLLVAPPAQAAGTWTTERVAGMEVRLYVPATAPANPDGRALMVSLHGCVQRNADLQRGGQWQQTADAHGMVVALPQAPDGGVLLGCWDYYGTGHSRAVPARHDDNLLDLVSALTARAALDLDRDQVYLTGLSSGGGQTMVMGCLAPDVFAGIGINAGPTVGTESSQIGSVATTETRARALCQSSSGGAPGFEDQLTSVVFGDDDTTVAPGYNPLNARVMAGLYGARSTTSFSLAGLRGTSTAGEGTLWSDAEGPRVSLVQNTGLGHNWPAGGGPGGSFISTRSIDYPAYVTGFFFAHNRRAGPASPVPTEPPPAPSDPEPPAVFSCGTATNVAHQLAGRAVSYGADPFNPFYARGSQDYMGQGDATTTTLRRTAAGTFRVVTSC